MGRLHSVCVFLFLSLFLSSSSFHFFSRQLQQREITTILYSEDNTWEPAENVAVCKNLLEEFERNLAKQKELKAAQQQASTKVVARASLPAQKAIIKVEASKPGPSTASQAG